MLLLNELRHRFGWLLIQSGALLAHVKEQMGHGSIQLTIDTHGHLVAGANAYFVDRLDHKSAIVRSVLHPAAPPMRLSPESAAEIPPEVCDLIGGGGWTRTSDLRIMRPSL